MTASFETAMLKSLNGISPSRDNLIVHTDSYIYLKIRRNKIGNVRAGVKGVYLILQVYLKVMQLLGC